MQVEAISWNWANRVRGKKDSQLSISLSWTPYALYFTVCLFVFLLQMKQDTKFLIKGIPC